MIRKLTSLILVLAFLVSMSGCATILKEKTTKVKVDSEPQGAEIYQEVKRGQLVKIGQTPDTIAFNNQTNVRLTFKKDGYKETKYTLRTSLADGWVFFSFICGIVPAWIDLATKNARNFQHKEIKVSLYPTGGKVSGADELLKYKKLLDDNVINKEEYEQKKKQLLGL